MSGRRKKKEEHEDAERWLLTYADMITLLVAFFMMMYSMSVLNLEKFKQAAIGIRSGFNGPSLGKKQGGDSIIEKGSRPAVMPLPTKKTIAPPARKKAATTGKRKIKKGRSSVGRMRARRVGELTKKLNLSLAGLGEGNTAKVVPESKGVAIELVGDLIFFPRGTAHLSEKARKILEAVARVLNNLPNQISIEGHTDKYAAVENPVFSTSWELSAARAMAVVKFLLSTGNVDPRRVSITGYGEYRPLKAKPEQMAENARPNNDRVRVFIFQN